jgi:glutamate synthase domain-containing protein 3
VHDPAGAFGERCNMGLVGFDEIDDEDVRELHALVEEHHLRTLSPVAARILANWEAELPRFVKVMPHDYKRALRELAALEPDWEGVGPTDEAHPASTQGEGFVTTESEDPHVVPSEAA